MMRVAVDTNGIYTTQAGVARYIKGLLKGLRRINVQDLAFFELAWEVENFGYRQPQRALKTAYRELYWANFVAPGRLRRERADLLHSTVNCLIQPPDDVGHVLSIMDLAFLLLPERFRRWQRWSWGRLLRRVPSVSRIMTISRFTADEVIRLLHVPASKIEVIYLGSEFHPDEPPAQEEKPGFTVPPEYLLFVGSLEPGKNLSLLKQAYAWARERQIALPPLLIVGARWEGVASEGPPPDDWHYLGRLSDGVLLHLYRRALALVFPSKYEGFGLPLCEAMAVGCPVICSRVASLPEVGGDAAHYVEMDPVSYAEAMRRIANEAGLRDELKTKGLAQAGRFSWNKCAAETVDVYRQALAG